MWVSSGEAQRMAVIEARRRWMLGSASVASELVVRVLCEQNNGLIGMEKPRTRKMED